MDEAKKTNNLRGPDFFNKYFAGKVIDIGAGNDLVCEWAERFDLEDGDANKITKYRPPNSYNTVHSSHCLEHMYDPRDALREWWELIKLGGYLVLVVPDEDLYEQGIWPSRFNSDHKATFTLKRNKSWSPVSYNVLALVSELPQAEVISAEIQDKYYDYKIQSKYPLPPEKPIPFLYRGIRKIFRRYPIIYSRLDRLIQNRLFKLCHIPIDQTMREAVAQIQVVAKKI